MQIQVPSPEDAEKKVKVFKGIAVECTLVSLHPHDTLFTSVCIEHSDDAKRIYAAVEALALSDFAVSSRLKGRGGEKGVGEEEEEEEDGGGDAQLAACVQGYPAFCLYAARVLQEASSAL
jgi:hypothetical protein